MARKDKPPFRLTRARRRVLLVLLTGAPCLSGFPICRAAAAGSGTVYVLLAKLEQLGWAASEWEQVEDDRLRRRFYRLTAEGRKAAMDLLGLENPYG